MLDFENTAAFEAFHTDTAAVTGKRLETGAAAARDLSLTCRCCLLVGDGADISERSVSAGAGFNVSVSILKKNWPDHTPPQKGDIFTVENYGAMSVISTPFQTASEYQVECYFKRA